VEAAGRLGLLQRVKAAAERPRPWLRVESDDGGWYQQTGLMILAGAVAWGCVRHGIPGHLCLRSRPASRSGCRILPAEPDRPGWRPAHSSWSRLLAVPARGPARESHASSPGVRAESQSTYSSSPEQADQTWGKPIGHHGSPRSPVFSRSTSRRSRGGSLRRPTSGHVCTPLMADRSSAAGATGAGAREAIAVRRPSGAGSVVLPGAMESLVFGCPIFDPARPPIPRDAACTPERDRLDWGQRRLASPGPHPSHRPVHNNRRAMQDLLSLDAPIGG
jgi:hypothetical protein